jgi:low affinity Fe/Cu permease
MKMINGGFDMMAEWTAKNLGSPYSFLIAVTLVLLWAVTGPVFEFNQTWQLVINTGTTIATFLMVFLLQNSQNRNNEELRINNEELRDHIKTMTKVNRQLLRKLTSIEETVEDIEEELLDDDDDLANVTVSS